MNPVLIGYCPRKRAIPSGPWIPPQVVQLCNAGNCDGLRPENWVDAWRHNELGLYDSLPLAWSVVPEPERAGFQIFAYRIFPIVIHKGRQQETQLPVVNAEPLPPDWERLGFDPVTFHGLIPEEHQHLRCFGHSPLSPFCNGRCSDIPVNRFCLLDDADEGWKRTIEFSSGGGEPEPYVLAEVWWVGGNDGDEFGRGAQTSRRLSADGGIFVQVRQSRAPAID